MENEKQSINQYEIYSEIIKKIQSKCNNSNFVEIREDGFDRKRHYILDGDIHVYIDKDGRCISVSNGDIYHSLEIEDGIEISLSMDNELEECGFNMYGQMGEIIEGIGIRYYKNFGYNYEVEGDTRDMWFLPSNIEAWDGNKPRKINFEHGELTSDIRELLEDAIKRSENSKTKNAYMQALEIYDKIIRVANRDEKITPTEALKSALRTTSTDKLNEASTVEQKELQQGETKKEK